MWKGLHLLDRSPPAKARGFPIEVHVFYADGPMTRSRRADAGRTRAERVCGRRSGNQGPDAAHTRRRRLFLEDLEPTDRFRVGDVGTGAHFLGDMSDGVHRDVVAVAAFEQTHGAAL